MKHETMFPSHQNRVMRFSTDCAEWLKKPTWESLEQHKTPAWFRDAKFGIWAHWGPQCVESSGDWMARSMYMEGSREYKWHVEHYGHPRSLALRTFCPSSRPRSGIQRLW